MSPSFAKSLAEDFLNIDLEECMEMSDYITNYNYNVYKKSCTNTDSNFISVPLNQTINPEPIPTPDQ